MSIVRQEMVQITQSPKVAAVVSAVTTGTGAGTILDWIPNDIGKLATVVGIVLSCVLIWVHVINLKKAQLELETLRAEKAARD